MDAVCGGPSGHRTSPGLRQWFGCRFRQLLQFKLEVCWRCFMHSGIYLKVNVYVTIVLEGLLKVVMFGCLCLWAAQDHSRQLLTCLPESCIIDSTRVCAGDQRGSRFKNCPCSVLSTFVDLKLIFCLNFSSIFYMLHAPPIIVFPSQGHASAPMTEWQNCLHFAFAQSGESTLTPYSPRCMHYMPLSVNGTG